MKELIINEQTVLRERRAYKVWISDEIAERVKNAGKNMYLDEHMDKAALIAEDGEGEFEVNDLNLLGERSDVVNGEISIEFTDPWSHTGDDLFPEQINPS